MQIELQKMQSFLPIIKKWQLSSAADRPNSISINCEPYHGHGLKIQNDHKYSMYIDENGIQVFLNDKLIDTTGEILVIDEKEVDRDFIFDIFNLFPNIQFHKYYEHGCIPHSCCYGPGGGTYQRVRNNRLLVTTASSCSNYSGGEALYDLKTYKCIDACCTCFSRDLCADNEITKHKRRRKNKNQDNYKIDKHLRWKTIN